jgi:hypothetical protein
LASSISNPIKSQKNRIVTLVLGSGIGSGRQKMTDKNKATRNKEEDPMLGVTADYRQVRRWKTALIGLVLFLS